MLKFFTEYTQELSLAVAAFAALVSVISAIIALAANFQNRRQYIDSIQPQLSMSLIEVEHELFLRVKNTGKTAAKSISVTVHRITNNGINGKLYLDDLFKGEFELYPEETVQGVVAMAGRNYTTSIFPAVELSVSYQCGNRKKKYQYDRSVTYFNGYADKISVDVNMDTSNIESALQSTNRAVVRIANYLDGRQVAAFDDLNILAGHSLQTDFQEILGQTPTSVLTRQETIHEALTGKKNNNATDGIVRN